MGALAYTKDDDESKKPAIKPSYGLILSSMKNTWRAFLRKYPTANKYARFAVNMADPEEWEVSDDPKKNTTRCCQMCRM